MPFLGCNTNCNPKNVYIYKTKKGYGTRGYKVGATCPDFSGALSSKIAKAELLDSGCKNTKKFCDTFFELAIWFYFLKTILN
jgi:hypothetical protein